MRKSLLIVFALALAGCHPAARQSGSTSDSGAASDAGIKGVHRDFRGRAEPSALFNDPDGKGVRLANFRGKPVLVNLWASWCAPCVKELPTLDKLARSGRIEVIAVSEDSGPHASVVAFLNSHRISSLKSFQDPAMSLSGALGPDAVLPTSILFDANGREVWRYIGDQDWNSAEASRLLSEAGASPARA